MAMPRMVKVAWAKVIQRRADLSVREGLLGAGEGCGDEDQEREIGGEGVVLLVGGEGEEDEDESGEEAEEKRGALTEVGCPEERLGRGRVALASAQCLEEEEHEGDEYGEEVREVHGLPEGEAHDNDGERLPEESLILENWVGFGVALKGAIGLQDDRAAEERPGEEPDEVEGPVEVAGELVVVHRIARPRKRRKCSLMK